jgi:hypothetical protein
VTWVRVDDNAPLHPKLLEAGPEAAWLWVCGLAHCNRSTTDGVIRKVFLPALFPAGCWSPAKLKQLAERLVAVRLWIDEGDAYRVHQYEIQQEAAMKEQVEARREYERSRKASRRAEKKTGTGGGSGPGHGPASVPDNVPDNRDVSHDPGPSRPVPARPEEISDRAPPLETGRAPTPAPAVVVRAFDEDTGIGRLALLALEQALREAGAAYVPADGDAGFLRTVADAAKACRGKRPLRAVLDDWARDFVQEFRVRSTKNFALYAQSRAANGGAKVRRAPDRREDTTPVAGSRPDALDAEARERAAKVERDRREAVPPPLDVAAMLRTGGASS